MNTPPHILITRPAHQSAHLIQQLNSLGARTTSFSSLTIRFLLDETAVKPLDSLHLDALIFTSANAVTALKPYSSHTPLQSIPCFAIGPATQGALQSAEFRHIHIPTDEQFNTDGLIALLKPEHQDLALFTGARSSHPLITALEESVHKLHVFECYERCINDGEDPKPILEHWRHGGWDAIVSYSQESLEAFVQQCRLESSTSLIPTTLIVIKTSMAEYAEHFNVFDRIIVAQNATDQAVITALKHTLWSTSS